MSKSHLIIRALVLVPIFAGCQPGEQVTVSGAVAKPGTYVYRPDKSANGYLEDAGGMTEEALLDSAYLVRGLVDFSDKEIIKSVTIPLSEHPEVLPDDEIKVPVRVYDVRLDTVRVLRDVRLVQENRIFKIPTGALVSGWTERGVLAALLLGRGKVYEMADTAKAVWAFHYLYVHLHPDEYGRVAGFAGDVIDSLEALEDAHAIHTRTRTQLDFEHYEGLQLPPAGYWRVLLGILLTPRSASFPGSGLRRRRFEDGRVWTTFPNGRQRWQYPDGRILHRSGTGYQVEIFPDGREIESNRFGQKITSWPDGRKEVRMPVAYSYPGSLRTDLAEVDPLPESVAVGEELTVSGQLHSEVEDISISAFLAPDGNVIKGNVRRRGRQFQARFRYPNLMQVARIRLEEMLALGKVSHFSLSGLGVMWHVTTRRLPFFQVSENVANGHFVETMQACWMLSAGHRSNILARHWTHVGVAVTKDRGLVWGVQVFARQ